MRVLAPSMPGRWRVVRDAGAMIEAEIVAMAAVGGAGGIVAGRIGVRLLRGLRRGVPPPRLWCELTVAASWAIVVARVAAGTLPTWWAAVPLLLGWMAVLLAVCDTLASRLPDALTLPAYPVAVVLLLVAAGVSGESELLVRGLVGAIVFAGTYGCVRLVSVTAIGPGDVKLAGSLGAVVGAVSLWAVLLTMLVAALVTAVVAGGLRRAVPHGPAMLIPAWLVTAFPGAGVFRSGLW